MNERNDRMATADHPPISGPTQHPAEPFSLDGLESAADDRAVDEVLELFRDAVERQVAERLDGDEALQSRLARVLRASQEPVAVNDDLVSYGHLVVTLWMRLLLVDRQYPVGLADGDLDEIAMETVARALNAAGADHPADEARRKVTFLVRCLEHLPSAYEGWRLGAHPLVVEELEDPGLVGAHLIGALRQRMADPRGTAKLMRKWAHAEDVDEIIAYSQGALHRHGELP